MPGMVGPNEVANRFGFHKATTDTGPMHANVRAMFADLANWCDQALPPGRELALALTALQEAAMWSNAAIACNLAPLVTE